MTTRQQQPQLTSQEFADQVDEIKASLSNIISLSAEVGRQGSVRATIRNEEVTVGPQMLKSFRSQINERLDNLRKAYGVTSRSKSRRRQRTEGEKKEPRLPNLSRLHPAYVEFWAGANLGNLNPGAGADESNPPVNTLLPTLTERGITSASLLQSAWATYMDQNELKGPDEEFDLTMILGADYLANIDYKKREKLEKRLFHADEYMNNQLGAVFDYLENEAINPTRLETYNKKIAAGDKADFPERFSRHGFQRYWTAVFGSFYTVPRPKVEPSLRQEAVGNVENLSAEEEAELKDVNTRNAVQNEINILKGVRERWNKLKADDLAAEEEGGEEEAEIGEEEEQ